jgi:hypothetical protein
MGSNGRNSSEGKVAGGVRGIHISSHRITSHHTMTNGSQPAVEVGVAELMSRRSAQARRAPRSQIMTLCIEGSKDADDRRTNRADEG